MCNQPSSGLRKVLGPEDCFLWGKVQKTQGVRGELKIFLIQDLEIEPDSPDFLFLLIDGQLIPFAVEQLSVYSVRSVVVKLMDVHGNEQARFLQNAEVFLPLGAAGQDKGKRIQGSTLIGFEVLDKKSGNIGKVSDVIRNPGQDLIMLRSGSKEILIPFVDEFILEIDRAGKVLHVLLPEGLAEING